MKNEIPIKVKDFSDYAFTARERMEIFVQESFIVAWLMEMNYLQNKMILDLIYEVTKNVDISILKNPTCR